VNDAGNERLCIGSYDPDEALVAATGADGRARVRVARPPSTAVVLGRSSRPRTELHLDQCLADGVALRRRRGGGCSVVLDPGNVVVAAAVTTPGLKVSDHFARLSEWLIQGLVQAGVASVERRDVSDMCLGDRKVGGACMFRGRALLLYSASLLVEPDLGLMDRYLRHPPREPPYRQGRAHRDFVTTLHGTSGISADRLTARLRSALAPPTL